MSDNHHGWAVLPFGQMVDSMGATRKSRGWDAGEAGLDLYVGLEHLDSNCLRISRWGSVESVGANSDLRVFEPGDVIFARRRIYQRKVGLAEFHGVASGHALVFRAKPEVVLPEFLPFFMQSDVFMERADRRSVGSLSQTVNLTTLLKEEFSLPPLAEQRRMVDVLREVERTDRALQALHARLETLKEAHREHVYRQANADSWPFRPLTELGAFHRASGGPKKDSRDSGVPVIRYGDLYTKYVDLIETADSYISEKAAHKYTRLKYGDILFAGSGETREDIGISAVNLVSDEIYCAGDIIVLRPDEEVHPIYLGFIANSVHSRIHKMRMCQGSTVMHIYEKHLSSLRVPCPPLAVQERLAATLLNINKELVHLDTRRARIGEVKFSFMRSVLR